MAFRPSAEKREEKERVRAALLSAALRLGAVHGFASLGLREVSREAGIAPTSFYRHFADMEELGAAIIGELVSAVVGSISEQVLKSTDDAFVATSVDAALRAAEREPELIRFVVAERVGASAQLRGLLRSELAALARALHTACVGLRASDLLPLMAAESAVVLLVDGCGQALDTTARSRSQLRDSLLWGVGRLLGA